MRLAEQGVSIYWRVRGWLLWWAPWSVSVGKENPKIARIIRRQRSWSSGHLNVRVFHWRIQIREGAAFVVLVCLVPNEIPLGLDFFFSKISRTIKFGCMLLGFLSLKFISRTSTTIFKCDFEMMPGGSTLLQVPLQLLDMKHSWC